MSATEVIAIDDDEDEEIKIVSANIPPPSKVNQLRLQIDLLQAFCESSQPIPMEYHKFYKFAKKVRSNVSDAIILAAWKRAVTKQLNCMIKKTSRSLRKGNSNISSTVDLTEPNVEASSSSSSHSKTQLSQPHHGSETEESNSPLAIPVPVALIANPQYHQNVDSPTDPLTVNNLTSNIDVALVDELENVTNCLVKVINESIQFSEGSNESFISEEETNCNSSTNKMFSSDSYCSKLNTPSDSENSPLCHPFNWEVFKDVNEEYIESDDSNLSINKQRKRKNKDYCNISLDSSTPNNVSRQLSSSFEHTRKRKRMSKTISISEAELKLFREKQKIKKIQENKKFQKKQLLRVYERLIEVFVPKGVNDSSKDIEVFVPKGVNDSSKDIEVFVPKGVNDFSKDN